MRPIDSGILAQLLGIEPRLASMGGADAPLIRPSQRCYIRAINGTAVGPRSFAAPGATLRVLAPKLQRPM